MCESKDGRVSAFDAYCKKCLYYALVDYKKKQKKISEKEVLCRKENSKYDFECGSSLKALKFEI